MMRWIPVKIAYVMYPDFTALDLVGPYEVISRWPDAEVHFLARSLEPVRCDCGLTVIPTDRDASRPRTNRRARKRQAGAGYERSGADRLASHRCSQLQLDRIG